MGIRTVVIVLLIPRGVRGHILRFLPLLLLLAALEHLFEELELSICEGDEEEGGGEDGEVDACHVCRC